MFFHILGITTLTDFHIFQRGSNHQPDIVPTCSYVIGELTLVSHDAMTDWPLPFFSKRIWSKFSKSDDMKRLYG